MNPELYKDRLKSKSVPELVKLADKHFNAFIRLRDVQRGCVSCNSFKVEYASHFYSAGNYKALRYIEDNVHGSCVKCNVFLRGNLLEYRQRLLKRIGAERLEKLEILAAWNKRNDYHCDRLSLIETILKDK